MLYRTTNSDIKDSGNYISYIGYAKLDINTNIVYDSNDKVIYPTLPKEAKGCEDPRIVEFEGSFYVFYTAYDGKKARVAIAKTDNFIEYTLHKLMTDIRRVFTLLFYDINKSEFGHNKNKLIRK